MSTFVSWVKQKFSGRRKATITADLKEKYHVFVKLIAENDYALELISELQEKLSGENIFTIPYLQNIVKKLLVSTQTIIRLLNKLTNNSCQLLDDSYRQIEQEIYDVMTGKKEPIVVLTAISLDKAYKEIADKIGDKMANLGEIKNRLMLPVPDGFAMTVCAYNQFMEYNGLDVVIPEILEGVDVEDGEKLMEVEQKIKSIVQQAELPPELSSYLHSGYSELSERCPGCFVSLRSSALGEDGESSFAGQYTSLLNVPPSQLEEAYKEVIASKYNARAIYYRRKKGYRDEDIAMSVGILRMVNAKIAGVIYTEDPNEPEKHNIIITAIWGLGQLLVDGQVPSDIYVLEKSRNLKILKKEIPTKRVYLLPKPEGGIQKARVPANLRNVPCLDNEKLQALLSYALRIEEYYKWPQDIEWAIGKDDTIYILQSRPLSLAQSTSDESIDLSSYPVLLEGGETACTGIAAGKVFRYRSEHDIVKCPKGAVLVASRTSPRFVKLMDKVSAIVTNLGSPTDHMSCLAREFQVPTLVNTWKATKRLPEGESVIVDASKRVVYRGEESFRISPTTKVTKPLLNIKKTQAYKLLDRLAPLLTKLNIFDYSSPDFVPENCKSLHDIIRYAHETALNAMFNLGEEVKMKGRGQAFRLESDLPLLIYVIDIEGCLDFGDEERKTISPEDIKCEIFASFWRGFSHETIPWKTLTPGQLDLKGMFSAMSQSMIDTLAPTQQMGDNYFILATNYFNASLRFGYHFTTIDSFVSENAVDNYISFTFKGGAAPLARRQRRVRFIAEILRDLDFDVKVEGDFIKARLKYETRNNCLEKLEELGKLTGCTRCIDMVLTSDAMVLRCIDYFKKGDYSLGLVSH